MHDTRWTILDQLNRAQTVDVGERTLAELA